MAESVETGSREIQHRFVYQVLGDERVVKVLLLWTHYE
jgi:Txe/YoeB family toxin of Txe-Axe toxin-antitoxin module